MKKQPVKPASTALENATATLATEAEAVMTTLCDILDRETEIVAASDYNAFKSIQQDKVAILTSYKSLIETLTRQSAASKATADILKARLSDVSARFQTSVERNRKALEGGRNTIQRLTDRIIKTARDTVHSTRQTYNYNGQSSLGTNTPISLKVDEIL